MIALSGSCAVILLWLAPVRDVWVAKNSIWATKSTERIATAFGYVAGLFNCILWNMYAVTRLNDMTVPFLVNLAGFFLNLSFVVCYWMFAVGKPRRDTKIQFSVLSAVTVFASFIWITTGSNESIGYIAAIVNVLMLFGPLAAANQVIKSRSTKGMPFPPLLLTLISSLIWFGYGLYIYNVPVMIPNGLGVIFGIVQISLFLWARRQEKKQPIVPEVHTDDGFVPIASHDDTLLQREDSAGLGIIHEESMGINDDAPTMA